MSTNFVYAAEAELACPVCFQYYVSPHVPKNLPNCCHICCGMCLDNIAKESGLKSIKCPQCNKVSKLPYDGVHGLTTILALRNLAERHPEGIKQIKERMKTQLLKQKIEKEGVLKVFEECEKEVHNSMDREIAMVKKCVDAVNKQAQDLIGQIEQAGKPTLTQLQTKLANLTSEITQMSSTYTELEEMNDDEFHAHSETIQSEIQNHSGDEQALTKSVHPEVGKFIPNDVLLGTFFKARRLHLIQKLQIGTARNITSTPNGLLVVCDDVVHLSSHHPIQVITLQYDEGEYKKQLQFGIRCGEIGKHTDVAATAEGKFLMTKCGTGIELYNSRGKYEKTISTQPEKSVSKSPVITTCVATTTDGRILAGSGMDVPGQKTRKWILTVHDLTGAILRSIPIDMMPLHITDIRGTHVAICGSKQVQDKVCVYVYDLESGKETLKIDIPIGRGIKFCYDEKSDCILLGRCVVEDRMRQPAQGSGVLEQYSGATGELVACIAQGLPPILGMTVTTDGLLAVSYTESVKLYKLL